MRRVLIVCSLIGASPASADTWATWVGDYKAKLEWRNCTAAGLSMPTLAFEAIDGALQIDLAPAGAALHAFSLIREDKAWVAQDGDVSVKLVQKKPNRIDLAIDFESGCTVRGKLERASTGVPACDALLAWSRIEARCTKTTAKLEDFAALAKLRWKKTDANKCTARADKLEHAMIDGGCAPHPDPNIGTRAVECRALVDATAKLQRCAGVPGDVAQRLRGLADQLSAASQTATPSTLQYVERQCKDAHTEIAAIAVQVRCQL